LDQPAPNIRYHAEDTSLVSLATSIRFNLEPVLLETYSTTVLKEHIAFNPGYFNILSVGIHVMLSARRSCI
jgi:hypothetical protein